MSTGRRTSAVLLVTALSLSLSACASSDAGGVIDVAGASQGGLHGTDISDVVSRPALSLTDTTGTRYDLATRPASTVTALFFGYTACPDVCPTAMADLSAARRALPDADRERLEVAFVTEDPAHDTPPVLRNWLDRFDSSFIGLIGGGQRTAATLTALKAPASEVLGSPVAAHDDAGQPAHRHPTGKDSVEHTGSVYVFSGSRTIVYTGGTTPGEYADDITRLMDA